MAACSLRSPAYPRISPTVVPPPNIPTRKPSFFFLPKDSSPSAPARNWVCPASPGRLNYGSTSAFIAMLFFTIERRSSKPLRLSEADILHSLKGEDSYGSHAYARIPSVGACHDGLTSAEDCEQANKASPASLHFTAATKSALAVKPHWTHENFSCVLRFSAVTVPPPGHLRLVLCGGTASSNPPRTRGSFGNWTATA